MTSLDFGKALPVPVSRSRRTRLIGASVAVLGALALSACATSTPYSQVEHEARAAADLASMFREQEPLTGPVTLEEAVARALKYNLDRRLKLMEEAVSRRQLDLAEMSLLPSLAASAGYTARSNYDTSVNQTLSGPRAGSVSDEYTTSSERSYGTARLVTSWNVLDFGIGYIRTRQQADQALIVSERRRQVVQNVVQDVRAAYWRAAAADRALARMETLLADVQGAVADAEGAVVQKVGSQIESLDYQRSMLESERQLKALRGQMLQAKTELATLMNLRPGTPFTIAAAQAPTPREVPSLPGAPDALERAALANRSEVRGEAYQLRVAENESWVALLRMLPGLELTSSLDYSSNRYLLNDTWATGGVELTWNLLNVLSGPRALELAESQEQLAQVRRHALSMAVLSQMKVADLTFRTAVEDYRLADRLAEVEGRMRDQLDAGAAAQQQSRRAVVRGRVGAALAELRRDMSYADMQAAWGRMFATIGADALPETIESSNVAAVATAVGRTFERWGKGDIPELVPAPVAESRAEPHPPGGEPQQVSWPAKDWFAWSIPSAQTGGGE